MGTVDPFGEDKRPQMHDPAVFESGAIGHPQNYFEDRGCSIDTRGPTRISGLSRFGNRVHTYSLSHHPAKYDEGVVLRPVVIDDYAWIGSDAILYNCHIGEGAVVAVGSVVRSRDVPPWTMVEGNPARIIARYDHDQGQWVYLRESEPLPMAEGWKGTIEPPKQAEVLMKPRIILSNPDFPDSSKLDRMWDAIKHDMPDPTERDDE